MWGGGGGGGGGEMRVGWWWWWWWVGGWGGEMRVAVGGETYCSVLHASRGLLWSARSCGDRDTGQRGGASEAPRCSARGGRPCPEPTHRPRHSRHKRRALQLSTHPPQALHPSCSQLSLCCPALPDPAQPAAPIKGRAAHLPQALDLRLSHLPCRAAHHSEQVLACPRRRTCACRGSGPAALRFPAPRNLAAGSAVACAPAPGAVLAPVVVQIFQVDLAHAVRGRRHRHHARAAGLPQERRRQQGLRPASALVQACTPPSHAAAAPATARVPALPAPALPAPALRSPPAAPPPTTRRPLPARSPPP